METGGRTDEDAREREGVLAKPIVERLCDVSRELEVLFLVFSNRDVCGSDATMGRKRGSARRAGAQSRVNGLVEQDVGSLEDGIGKETKLKLVVRDFRDGSVLLIGDLALQRAKKRSQPSRVASGRTREKPTFQVVIRLSLPIGVIVLRIQASSACSGTFKSEENGQRGPTKRRKRRVELTMS